MSDNASVFPSRPSLASQSSSRVATVIAAAGLIGVLLYGVPQYLRMPLTNDPVYFDLQASLLRHGGVLYRDYVEPNFPGVVWIHAAVRPLVGESSEGLRCFDLSMFATTVGMLGWAVRRLTGSTIGALGLATALFWFYLSLAEWSHGQRDVWLLVPATLAVTLRLAQLPRLSATSTRRTALFGYAFLEGLVWGAGVWLKPHLALVGLIVWLTGAVASRRRGRIVPDMTGLLAGGLVAGLLGMAWLRSTGAWPHFYESFTHLAPEYAAVGRRNWNYSRFVSMGFRLAPWGLLHLAAAPLAVTWLVRALRESRTTRLPDDGLGARSPLPTISRGVWSAMYLAWTIQALFLQILFDYVHVPGIVLAAFLLGAWFVAKPRTVALRTVLVVFAGTAFMLSPLASTSRLALWPTCVVGPSTPTLKDQLRRIREPSWVELERLAEFLDAQELRDGDLIAYGNHLIHLYPRLHIRPANRYVYQAWYLKSMPGRKADLARDLSEHPPRFIVSDLSVVLGRAEFADMPGADGPHSLPEDIPEKFLQDYPLRYPIVFRAGGLLVHRYQKAAP